MSEWLKTVSVYLARNLLIMHDILICYGMAALLPIMLKLSQSHVLLSNLHYIDSGWSTD